jgi:riboflavin kinase/FMN adenylyltransferase
MELCRQMADELGLTAQQMELVKVDGRVVSSTAIRRAVSRAELARAARLLGRPFSLFGTVVPGAGRGRGLGYPTANLDVHNELMPRDGVYATRTCVAHRWLDSVASVGVQRTFSTGARQRSLVEVHVMGVQLDLCGQDIEVQFIERLRAQKRFASAEALARQIGRDIAQARRVLGSREQSMPA